MEPVVRMRHCGKDIYRFSGSEDKSSCPVCGQRLVLGLLEAPVSVPCPFNDGHAAPGALLIGAHCGPLALGDWKDSELHVGISNSAGSVYNYTLTGVRRDEDGWEQCVCVPLVPPWRRDLKRLWDEELDRFAARPDWIPERFSEEREFGSCCYGFALTFINHVRSLDGNVPLSRDEFTRDHVLPRMKRASVYVRMYEGISQAGFYITDG